MQAAVTTIETTKPFIADRVAKERADSRQSQAAIAKEIGISETRLSQYLNGTYHEIVSAEKIEELEAKILQWLESREARRQVKTDLPNSPGWTETPTAKRIMATLTYAQIANDLVVIYGGAGLGKSKTIAYYKSQNPNVWVIESTPTTATMGGILRAFAKAVGASKPDGHNDALEAAIIERIKNTNGLLVVDEAQFLNERGLECARRICELAGVGLAFVGNETVYAQLTGRNRAAEFAQLFSRIGKRCRLATVSEQDVSIIASAWSITDKALQQMLTDIARKPGALRIVDKVLRLATVMAQGCAIEKKHIASAWRDLGGES